jgi:hypothetical protein
MSFTAQVMGLTIGAAVVLVSVGAEELEPRWDRRTPTP